MFCPYIFSCQHILAINETSHGIRIVAKRPISSIRAAICLIIDRVASTWRALLRVTEVLREDQRNTKRQSESQRGDFSTSPTLCQDNYVLLRCHTPCRMHFGPNEHPSFRHQRHRICRGINSRNGTYFATFSPGCCSRNVAGPTSNFESSLTFCPWVDVVE